MADLYEQKCPACTAAMRYDPGLGKMVCDYCGTTVDIKQEAPAPAEEKPADEAKTSEAAIEGFNFAALNSSAESVGPASLPVYTCVSCGADLIVPAAQATLTCPYCGNNIVLSEKVSGPLRPNGVIPFTIAPDSLPAAVRRYYKDKKLLPRGFFSNASIGEITGVYVPFWVFSGTLSGRMLFSAEKSGTKRRGDYLITETDHYELVRDCGLSFQGIPVDTSGRIDDALMDSLEPFDLRAVQPFDVRYLAGYTAERFDQKKSDIANRAEGRMRQTAANVIAPLAGPGYSGVRSSGGSMRADMDAKYLLFPVYLFDLEFDNKKYPFAVNGQTGKVVGEVPESTATAWRYFLKKTGIVAGTLIAFSVAKYMLGF